MPRFPRITASLAFVAAAFSLLARPVAAEDWIQKGEAKLKQDQFEAALDLFNKALAEDSKSYAALVGIGRCRIHLDDVDNAIEVLQKAKTLDGSKADAFLYLGIASYTKAQALAESGAQATVVGSLYRDARSALQSAVSKDAKNLLAYQTLGLVSVQLEAYDEATSAFQKAVEIQPTDAWAHYQLGEVSYVQEKYAQAVPHYSAAIKASPYDPASYQKLGYCHQFLQDTAKAEETYRQAIQKIPDSQLAFNDLFNLYAGDNKFKEAVEAYKKLLEADPKNAKVRWYLGYVYRQVGVDDKATAEFKKAIELSPKMYSAYEQLGLIQKGAKDTDGALKYFRKTLEIARELKADMKDSESVTSLWQIAGETLMEEKRTDDSIAIFRELTQTVPDNGKIWSDLGLVLRDSGKFEESLAAYQKAAALLPEDAQILNDLAVVLDFHLNRHDEAFALYEKAAKLADIPDALENYSRMLIDKGRYLEAIKACDRALAAEPGRTKVIRQRDKARELLKKQEGGGQTGGGF